jgi:hypothetical protein
MRANPSRLSIRSCAALLLMAALGCNRIADPVDESAEDGTTTGDPPAACEGMLGPTPTKFAETWAFGHDVIVDGDTLVLVEPGQYGYLRRLDRCTGAELRAIEVPFLDRAILHEGAVVFTGVSEGPNPYLMRWDEAAEDLVFLAEVPFSRLYSLSTGLYLAAGDEIHRLDEDNESTVLVHTIDTPLDVPGLYVSHVGGNEAGLYYVVDYDCGCTPALSRWPIGAADTVGVGGSAGARRLATVGDRIFVDVDPNPNGFGSGVDDIVELPAEGGEPQLLFSGTLEDGPVQDIAANDEWVCWTNAVDGPHCVNRADPTELREFESVGAYGPIALAEDAVYWFVEHDAVSELMGAAL